MIVWSSGRQTVGFGPVVARLVLFIGPLSVVGRVVRKSYNPAPVAWAKT